MKLLRYGTPGHEKPAILDRSGQPRDLAAIISDLHPSTLTHEALQHLKNVDLSNLPAVPADERIGPCVGTPGKLVCVGLNYYDHAKESNMEIPTEPVIFMKATSSICGPSDSVYLPPGSRKTDWEVELGVVIGATLRHVSEERALDGVAGFCIINDVSERSFQLEREGQWVKGKSYDHFAPLGPWLVTLDEIANPHNLALRLTLNGQVYQASNTSQMIFNIPFLISYLSNFMTLHPGDVISTGTPPGVGLGQSPQKYLVEGDVIELEIEGLGSQRQAVIRAPYEVEV